MPVLAEPQRMSTAPTYSHIDTEELVKELTRRIPGLDADQLFQLLDRKAFPIWLLSKGAWFRVAARWQDADTVGQVVSGGSADCDALVEFVKKHGEKCKDRYYISGMTLICPIRDGEISEQMVKGKNGKPIVIAVEASNPDDIVSNNLFVEAGTGASDDLFSEA